MVKVLRMLKLGLAAALLVAGLAGFVIVLKQGVLVSGNPAGHSPGYAAGWSLFFFLMLGIPCLLAVVFGALPWIAWWRERRKDQWGKGI